MRTTTPRRPLAGAVAERLPDGVFYILAGSDPASYNLWQVSNTGREVRLTHNSQGFGISAFGASPAGIIMADAASGFDKLARLTANGAAFLKDGNGSGPTVNAAGEICYETSTYDTDGNVTGSELLVRKSFTAPARVAYRTKDDISATAWGPGSAIAVLTGSHYPGTKGSTPRAFVLAQSGRITNIHTSAGANLGSVVWNERQGGLGVATWTSNGEVVYRNSRTYALPAGWSPAAWNPDGTQLLVWGPGPGERIGLWSPGKPKSVKVIGPLAKNFTVGEFAWLARPAKL